MNVFIIIMKLLYKKYIKFFLIIINIIKIMNKNNENNENNQQNSIEIINSNENLDKKLEILFV